MQKFFHFQSIHLTKTASLVLIFTLLLSGCKQPANERISKSDFYFDTIITVTLYDNTQEDLLTGCFELAKKYENLFSTTIDTSDISKINAAKGKTVTVDPETITLLKKGLFYGDLSNGRFDVTIRKLSALWNFSENEGEIPNDSDIKKAVDTIDYRNVEINGNEVTLKNPQAAIDLGGIAKGYIADKMKEYLNENGVTAGIINLGGNVLTIGEKEDGPYNIGIQKPFAEDGTLLFTVEITDQTVVSSGTYERCFTVDDKIYHHILDISTGYPYDNGLLGVTIICKNSVDGDGLSTTCFALGLTDGMKLIESLENVEAVFITDDYQLHMSSGMGTEIPYSIIE